MNKKYDDRQLDIIAQDMLSWCLTQGCQKLGENNKEYRVQCPNINCPSRQKSESHKAFDINKDSAQYHCWHCGLKGKGLHGSKGLIATLKNGDFSPSASFSKQPSDNFMSKPKEKAEPVMSKDELPPIAKSLCKEARAYFTKRCIPENVYGDFDLRIFSAPVGTQLSFMKQPLQDTAIFFPIFNDDREVIHAHYKLLRGGYYMSPGPKPIYLTKATALSTVVVLEGIFDALSVYTAGYQGAALLGHEITSNHNLSVFEGKKVVVMLDNDDAGKTSMNPIASTLLNVAQEVKVVEIPPELGKDANDVLMKTGKDTLSELIKNAVLYQPNTESDVTESVSGNAVNVESQIDISQEETSSDNAKSQSDITTETKVEIPVSVNQPKGQIGIAFPEQAWRGIFDTYRKAQKDSTEAPEQYHFAVLSTIAGVLMGRSCYVYTGRELYPNFYTAIIGPTGKSRKDTAVSRGDDLIRNVSPNVITTHGLATPEGFIGILQEPAAEEVDDLPEHEQQRSLSVTNYEGFRCLVICTELATLLKKATQETSKGLIPVLTQAYDCRPFLENPTRVNPLKARAPTVAMLGVSTAEWLERNLDIGDVFGGFGNRFVFYNWAPTGPIADPIEPDGYLIRQIEEYLIKTLTVQREKQNKFTWDANAKDLLTKWYNERYYCEYKSEVIAAIVERIDTNMRKLALLYAALENEADDFEIHLDQLQSAIAVAEYWQAVAIDLFGKFGFTKATRDEMRVLGALGDEKLTKGALHRRLGGRLSAKEVDSIINSLVSIGQVKWISEKRTDTRGRNYTTKVLAQE
ncbi:toprim domain-containing protein [bacterium]|nr:toprim domain-containing protein [bacterium]